MIIKEKPCKGIGKAKGYGCGKVVILHPMRKGLCFECWINWLTDTKEGGEHLKKSTLKASKEIQYNKRKEKTKKKRALMSVDQYRAKVLQPVINEIVRLIDKDQPCIATRRVKGKMAAGHFHSVGRNRATALNLHNIHIQSYESNSFQGGDELNYYKGLIETYGKRYAEFVDAIPKNTGVKKFTKIKLEEALPVAQEIRIDLRKKDLVYSAEERISIRNELNEIIGLYGNEGIFK